MSLEALKTDVDEKWQGRRTFFEIRPQINHGESFGSQTRTLLHGFTHTHTRLVCWKWQVVFCRMAIPSPKESFDRKTSNAGLNHIIIHLSRNYFAPWCFSDQTSQQPQICFFCTDWATMCVKTLYTDFPFRHLTGEFLFPSSPLTGLKGQDHADTGYTSYFPAPIKKYYRRGCA